MRIGAVLLLFASVQGLRAQSESFDLATFSAPAGWKRSEANGSLMFEDRKRVLGRIEFCQIYLFPSQPGGVSPAIDFQSQWEARMVRGLGIPQRPIPKFDATPDGWKTATGFVDTLRQGVAMRALLATYSRFGKLVSVMVVVSPNAYGTELGGFFRSLHLRAAADGGGPLPQSPLDGPPMLGAPSPARPPAVSSTPATATAPMLGSPNSARLPAAAPVGPLGYGFTAPEGWARQDSRDRTVLVSPVFQGGERCQLTLLPLRPLSRTIADEALTAYRGNFQTEPLTGDIYPPTKLERGTSAEGWDFFVIRKPIGRPDPSLGTILMAVQVGRQVATVVATSKTSLVSNCFGELVADRWPAFFYSLSFQNAGSPDQVRLALQQAMSGTWITATASVGLRYEFHSDGRYAGAGATQYRTRVSPNEVLATTTAYFGDGAYSFDGNTLVMKGDDGRVSRKSFRLQQVSKDFGRSWAAELCLLDPGASGEVCYRKE
jgi:hypothetical protein